MKKIILASFILFVSAAFAECAISNRRPVPGTQRMKPKEEPVEYDQGHDIEKTQMMSGYNAPSRYDVKGNWDIFLTGTFIYWQTLEGGLSFVSSVQNPTPASGRLPVFGASQEEIEFNYKPGFKVGLGLNSGFDNWDVYFEYTWMHFTQSRSVSQGNGRLFVATWFDTAQNAGGNNALMSRAVAKWKLSMNLLDLELGRFYYVGTNLSFRPHIGARAAFNSQRFNVGGDFIGINNAFRESRNKQSSWALGARAGVDTNWFLGMGFRTFGNIASSLLYARYKITEEEDTITAAVVTNSNIALTINQKYHVLRPNLELTLGFGWGTYFADNNWHFDLAGSYDFHMFWNENYMYSLSQTKSTGYTYKAEDLYMHGFTLTARFDF